MAGGTVGTVRRALRLPTVAECAELLAGGWPPVLERLGVWAETLRRTIDAGDLAGLARREAGPVTRRQWRACARCGQCFWLADDEAVPGHGVRDAWGADRACGAVVTSEGSEGR